MPLKQPRCFSNLKYIGNANSGAQFWSGSWFCFSNKVRLLLWVTNTRPVDLDPVLLRQGGGRKAGRGLRCRTQRMLFWSFHLCLCFWTVTSSWVILPSLGLRVSHVICNAHCKRDMEAHYPSVRIPRQQRQSIKLSTGSCVAAQAIHSWKQCRWAFLL